MSDDRIPDKAVLAPCPFCGKAAPIVGLITGADLYDDDEEPALYDQYATQYAGNCNASRNGGDPAGGCGSTGGWASTEAEAADKWNRRAAPPTEPAKGEG